MAIVAAIGLHWCFFWWGWGEEYLVLWSFKALSIERKAAEPVEVVDGDFERWKREMDAKLGLPPRPPPAPIVDVFVWGIHFRFPAARVGYLSAIMLGLVAPMTLLVSGVLVGLGASARSSRHSPTTGTS